MKIIVATRNNGKLEEFDRILSPLGYQVVGQEELCPGVEVEENGATFAENAYKKAHEIFLRTGLPTIADDSGLCVDALNGEPGVYSARYAGEPHSDEACNRKLLQNLEGVPAEARTARFISAICCVFAEDDVVACEDGCEGRIGFEPRGTGGFGYDPLFLVGGKSFSELSGGEKDAVSHRGKALRAFAQMMKRRTNHC